MRRRRSRGDAERQLDRAGLREQMKGKAWNAGSASALIDEDPRLQGHRQVMADQSDPTEVPHVLTQVLNYGHRRRTRPQGAAARSVEMIFFQRNGRRLPLNAAGLAALTAAAGDDGPGGTAPADAD